MSAKPNRESPPSLGEFLLEVQRREKEAPGDFELVAPDLLSVKVDGRIRVRAETVLAASGRVGVTPASRFAKLAGKEPSGGVLAALDGKGRVLLGEAGKTLGLLQLSREESLVVSPAAIVALEDTLAFEAQPIELPLKKSVVWPALRFSGPGRFAYAFRGSLHTMRVVSGTPLFVRTGAVVAWTANLTAVGRAGTAGDARVAFAGEGYVLLQSGL